MIVIDCVFVLVEGDAAAGGLPEPARAGAGAGVDRGPSRRPKLGRRCQRLVERRLLQERLERRQRHVAPTAVRVGLVVLFFRLTPIKKNNQIFVTTRSVVTTNTFPSRVLLDLRNFAFRQCCHLAAQS